MVFSEQIAVLRFISFLSDRDNPNVWDLLLVMVLARK